MLKINWDITDYNQTSKLYAHFWKGLPFDLVTKECRDVAIKALMLTKFTSREKIGEEMEAPSKSNPKQPLKVVLAGWISRKTGESITPAQLKKKRVNSANAVRGGFANGARFHKNLNKGGGFIPRLRTSSRLGNGTVIPSNASTPATVAKGTIYNSFGDNNQKVRAIQEQGLEKAKRFVAADRAIYCLRQLAKIKNKIGAWK